MPINNFKVQIQLLELTNIGDYQRHKTMSRAISERTARKVYELISKELEKTVEHVRYDLEQKPVTDFDFLQTG